MKTFKHWLMSWITMSRQEALFIDRVSGQIIFRYIDCYKNEWMAEFDYFGFRVEL